MSLDLCKKKCFFFFSKMSSEWMEFYESFVHALVHIRLRFWKLYLISFDFHQSDDQQIISEFCSLQLYCSNFSWRGIMLACSAFI